MGDERPEVGRYSFVYKGGEGYYLTVVRLGPREEGKALLRFGWFDHPWDGRIIEHRVTREGNGKIEYSLDYQGSPFVTFRGERENSGRGYTLYMPGYGPAIAMEYNEEASREVRPQWLLTQFLQQEPFDL